MKLVFLSNYYTHHQKALCENWSHITNKSFEFIATEAFSSERAQMGWKNETPSFVSFYDDSKKEVIENSEIVVLGNAPLQSVQDRLNDKKIVFKYSERVFKHGYSYLKWLPRLYTYYRSYGRHKSLYLLSAGAFVSADYAMHRAFIGKSYKWGYFPETKLYDIDDLLSKKQFNKILWCGRFIDWKHPEQVMELARRLKNAGIDFSVSMIGTGEMKAKLESLVVEFGLEKQIEILDAMTPSQIRVQMESAGIYLFTSDFNEGWGAVLNESMNSACAVVASHAIGAAPYLVKHGENGLIYTSENMDDLYLKVKVLLEHPERQKELGRKAYYTITELWNADVAAKRFVKLNEEIIEKGFCDLFDEGPCSKAEPLKNNWFREGDYDVSWLKA